MGESRTSATGIHSLLLQLEWGVSGVVLFSAIVNAQETLRTMQRRKRKSVPSSLPESAAADHVFQPKKSAKRSSFPVQAHASVGSSASGGQTYGIATFDALFKYVLSNDEIRPSFFHAFIPELTITASKRLDDHMNPVQDLQHLRDFIHQKETAETVGKLSSAPWFVSGPRSGAKKRSNSKNDQATKFLREFLKHFEDMKKAFPKAQYDGTMDFVCQLGNGEFALVEMQVFPQDCWDRRALAYVAAFYGNQLRKGSDWREIKKVVGINILGGGTRQEVHWKGTEQYVRHYKVEEQLHKTSGGRFIDGIELIQYSVTNAPDILPSSDQEKQDWIAFFKRGARMNEEQVKSEIRTEAVLKAFEMATLSKMPQRVKDDYESENSTYTQVSQYTAEKYAEGEAKGRADALAEAVRVLKEETELSDEAIASKLQLDVSQVAGINIAAKSSKPSSS